MQPLPIDPTRGSHLRRRLLLIIWHKLIPQLDISAWLTDRLIKDESSHVGPIMMSHDKMTAVVARIKKKIMGIFYPRCSLIVKRGHFGMVFRFSCSSITVNGSLAFRFFSSFFHSGVFFFFSPCLNYETRVNCFQSGCFWSSGLRQPGAKERDSHFLPVLCHCLTSTVIDLHLASM